MTKQTQKVAPKVAPKAAPKARQQKTLAYAAILAEALSGKFGDRVKAFYVSAIKYHAAKGTSFPRARNATEALMPADDARAFLTKHAATSIPSGSKPAQRVFDEMMAQAPQVLAEAKKALSK